LAKHHKLLKKKTALLRRSKLSRKQLKVLKKITQKQVVFVQKAIQTLTKAKQTPKTQAELKTQQTLLSILNSEIKDYDTQIKLLKK